MNATEKTTRLAEIDARQEAIEQECIEQHDGRFTPKLRFEYDRLKDEYDRLSQKPTALPRRTPAESGAPASGSERLGLPAPRWVNVRTGEPVRTYAPNQRMAAAHETADDLSVGRFMQAIATGNWRHAEAEKRVLALGGNDTSGGHFLVPDELSSMVIDLARSASVLFPWGATTVDMTSETLSIARVVTDPTFEVKGENVAFSGGDPTFGSVTLVSRTLGTVVTSSRELAEDAPNFPTVIETILQRGLATELDRLCLVGNGGSDGVNGIKNYTDIGSTGSVGAIAWEDVHGAVVALQALNHQPNGYVVHPTIGGDLDILTSGDGTNSAKLWLGPPPSLNGVMRLPTTGITTADILVGDGTKIVVGFRTQARVEVSTEAGDAFDKHQIKWKITLRFDLGLTHSEAFHNLTGITT